MSNRGEASTSQAGGDPPPIDKEVLKTSFLEMLSDPTALASAASGAATKGGAAEDETHRTADDHADG